MAENYTVVGSDQTLDMYLLECAYTSLLYSVIMLVLTGGNPANHVNAL
jgi:hypothetical protein